MKWVLLGTSLLVGVALAVDGFLNLGERWRHYRIAAEGLKSQDWRFIQGTEPYGSADVAQNARAFAGRVEELIDAETGGYVNGPARTAATPTTSP